MAVECPYCSSTLANNYNLKRHVGLKHRELNDSEMANDIDQEAIESVTDQESDEDETESDSNDQGSDEEETDVDSETDEDSCSGAEGGTYTHEEVIAILRFYLQQRDK